MKKICEFAMMKKDEGLEYLAGVPAAEKRLYWSESPWAAFRVFARYREIPLHSRRSGAECALIRKFNFLCAYAVLLDFVTVSMTTMVTIVEAMAMSRQTISGTKLIRKPVIT